MLRDWPQGSRPSSSRAVSAAPNGRRTTTELGQERVGGVVWPAYDQPSVGGLVYARRCRDGVEIVLAGDRRREPLRALAATVTRAR